MNGPADSKTRCPWCLKTPAYVHYHDTEWGVPVHDDLRHFEFLVLESAQAGLSWLTVLNKRKGYARAFAGFDPEKVARFTATQINQLLSNPDIIRNRLKIEAAVHNARRFLKIQEAFGSFDAYIWRFVNGKTIVHHWTSLKQIPATSVHSDALSRDMKQRGFKFTGSTVMYAHLPAWGLINDHLVDCFRYRQV
jgi:DNA-3-methyladenine glycosylase I